MAGSEKKKWLSPPNAAGGLGRLPSSTVARGARVAEGVMVGVAEMVGVGVPDGVAVIASVGESVTVGVALAVTVAAGVGVRGSAVPVGAVAVNVRRSATCDPIGSLVGAAA